MRSNLVFRAQEKVTNRFELCLLVARSVRAMNSNTSQMHDAINNAFSLIGKHCGLFSSLGPLADFHAEISQVADQEVPVVTSLEFQIESSPLEQADQAVAD
jgi:hypothetical protein